jgi:hypothetical protein
VFREKNVGSIKLVVDKDKHSIAKLTSLKNIFLKYPGSVPVYIHLTDKGNIAEIFSLKETRIKITDEFIKEIQTCLGDDSITFIRK